MTTGEGVNARDERSDRDDREPRGERIGIGGGDDSVTRIQLAARWAESYGPATDSLGSILRRFRAAYEYLDAVTHGVEPPNIEEEVASTRTAVQPVAAPAYAAPPQQQSTSSYAPPSSPSYAPPGMPDPAPPPPNAPPSEPRPWS